MIDPGFFEYFFTGEIQHHRKKMIHKAEKSLFHCCIFYLIRRLIFKSLNWNGSDRIPAYLTLLSFHTCRELKRYIKLLSIFIRQVRHCVDCLIDCMNRRLERKIGKEAFFK